ncbi:MAG: extracellular solute-binding protein [Cyanobium sp.]
MPPLRAPTRWPCRLLRRGAGLLAGLLAATGLAACSPQAELPQVLFIAVGTNPDQVIDGRLHVEFRERLRLMERNFRKFHPGIRFRFSLYPEEGLIEAMRHRQWAGLEPDLLFVTGKAAHELLQAGITIPFPAKPEQLSGLDPAMLHMVSLPDGRLSGLPALQQLQISCYDNRRLEAPPTRINDLLAASARGVPIGLSITGDSLFWTVGSLGALPAVEHLLRGEAATTADRAALKGWLTWLQTASTQQRVAFYGNQDQAELQLEQGQFAWIPCRSSTLPRLRRAMGTKLGVAALPDGDGSSAAAINYLRVLALGRNSTPRARQAAMRYAAFTLNPLVQRSLTLGSYTVLPVNRHVSIPMSSSQILAALVKARDQGLQIERIRPLLQPGDPRVAQVQALLTEVVFGEVSAEAATPRLIAILRSRP